LLIAVYADFSVALNGMFAAKEVFRERNEKDKAKSSYYFS